MGTQPGTQHLCSSTPTTYKFPGKLSDSITMPVYAQHVVCPWQLPWMISSRTVVSVYTWICMHACMCCALAMTNSPPTRLPQEKCTQPNIYRELSMVGIVCFRLNKNFDFLLWLLWMLSHSNCIHHQQGTGSKDKLSSSYMSLIATTIINFYTTHLQVLTSCVETSQIYWCTGGLHTDVLVHRWTLLSLGTMHGRATYWCVSSHRVTDGHCSP